MSTDLSEANEQVLASSGQALAIHKAFSCKDFSGFSVKFPLLCLPCGSVPQLREVRAESRFPSEIKKEGLYLGNMTNVLNKDYF